MDIFDKNKILYCFNVFPASFQTGMHWKPKIITYLTLKWAPKAKQNLKNSELNLMIGGTMVCE